MGSIGLVENKHQCVYQPYMKGDIFCVDVVEDSNGHSCAVARKELLRPKTGAGVTVELQNEKTIIALSKAVCDALNVLGCINMEFIRNNDTYYLVDINPRFSAGIGFSMLTGYDVAINHIKCFDGEDVEEQILYKNEIISKRYKVMC
jgi:carbamoyl-phosphate synthase large subunit